MKPLELEVFPKAPPRPDVDIGSADGWLAISAWESVRVLEDLYRDMKHLTSAELAAEYHQQAAYNAYWNDQATIAAVRRNEDRLATLHRFATLPSYDQEENDV